MGLFQFGSFIPRGGTILPLNTQVPSRSGPAHKIPSISLKDFLVSITKRSCAPSEVNNQVKHDILVPVRVTLSIHALGNGVGSKFCLLTILKFNNIPSGVKYGVFIGATDDIFIIVTRTLQQPTSCQALTTRQLKSRSNTIVRSLWCSRG